MANQLKLANFWDQRRANSSNVWDHFGFKCNEEGAILDKTKAICKHCSAEIKYKGGNTSNLSAHVSSYYLSEVKPSGSTTLQPKINAVLSGPKMYPKNSATYLMIQQKLADHIVAGMKPFSIVQSETFIDFCNALNPKFALPSKTTRSQCVIPKMYQDVKQEV